MDLAILIAYFAQQDEARKVFRELARQDVRRAVLVHKAANGDVHIRDPFLWRRASGVTLAAVLSGGLAGVAVLVLQWLGLLSSGNLFTLILFPAAAAIGASAALLWLRRSRYGVESGVVRDHARWLVSGETVLILQTPVASLPRPVAVLRESDETPSALFVMYPKCERRAEARAPKVKLW